MSMGNAHEATGADRHVGELECLDDLAGFEVPDVALACRKGKNSMLELFRDVYGDIMSIWMGPRDQREKVSYQSKAL